MRQSYVIALGSNMRVPGIGNPRKVLAEALDVLADRGVTVLAASPIIDSAPIGPSLRRYANAAAVIEAELEPTEMLALLQDVESQFGRRRLGRRWRARPLDLDIVLWSGGVWLSPGITVPHPRFRSRDFVLRPAARIAAAWRDPISLLTLRQLAARGA